MTIRIEVPPSGMFLVGARDQDRRERGDGGKEERAGEGQAREDPVEELRGGAAGPHAGNEAPRTF